MSVIHLVGGAGTIHLLRSEHPEIFEGCPDDVTGCWIDSDIDVDINRINVPGRTNGTKIIGGPWAGECPELPDCKAAPDDIDEKQSWQQMNRGNLSKKQRRK